MGLDQIKSGFSLDSAGIVKEPILAATPTEILAANPSRKALFMQALSTNASPVYIQIGRVSAATDGIELVAGATAFIDTNNVPNDAVSAFSASAADIMIYERD